MMKRILHSDLFPGLVAGTVYSVFMFPRLIVGNLAAQLGGDTVYYTLASQRIAEGNFSEALSAVWMPLWPALGAVLVFLGVPPLHALGALNVLFGLAFVIAVTVLAQRWFGNLWGVLAGLAMATDPLLLKFCSSAMSDPGAALLAFATLGALVRADGRKKITPFGALVLGLLGGAIVLSRVALLPLALLVGAYVGKRGWENRKSRGSILVAGLTPIALAVLIPSALYFSRLHYFAPSANFFLNKYYTAKSFIDKDPGVFCRLYDGKNTVMGDLEYLSPGAQFPTLPTTKFSALVRYRVDCLVAFCRQAATFVGIPVMAGALFGIFRLLEKRRRRWLAGLAAWTGACLGAIVLSNIQTRFFMPMLPVAYLLFAFGVWSLAKELKLARVGWAFGIAAAAFNAIAGLNDSNVALLAGEKLGSPTSGGEHVFRTYGAGRRVATDDNFLAAVQSRGRWKILPCEADAAQVDDYLVDKKIEFVILPNRREVASSKLERVWEGANDVVYRVKD